MAKSPAFQMYPADILSSPSCSLMSAEQMGAYCLLLFHSWMADDCGIPADDEALGKLSRLGTEGWLKIGCPLVRDRFVQNGERLYNKRLLEEREKQKIWREKSAAGGRKSGQVRRKSRKNNTVTTVKGGSVLVGTKREPNHEPNTNSSSLSSSSNNPSICSPDSEQRLLVQDFDPKPELDRIFETIKAEHPKGKNSNTRKAREQYDRRIKEKPNQRISRANAILDAHRGWQKAWSAGRFAPDLFRWIRDWDEDSEPPTANIEQRQKANPDAEILARWNETNAANG